MSDRVFVQQVKVFWSKASRGAPLSTARNLCPDAFALSPTELAALVAGDCYSSVVMREQDRFSPNRTIGAFSDGERFQWPCVSVKFLNNQVPVVRYAYESRVEGAPNRLGRPPIVHQLTAGKLLQIQFNSRDSWPTGEWHYQLTTFNILLTETPSAEIFLASPDKTISDLEDLW